MKVAFDTTILNVDRAGSANYARQILRHVEESGEVDEVIRLRSGAGIGGRLSRRGRLLWNDTVWAPFLLPKVAASRGADILHCLAYKAPVRSSIPFVVTIHDVYPLQNPRAFGAWWAWYFRNVVSRAARRADRIITSSEYSAAEICGAWDIDRSRVRVFRYGVSAAYESPPSEGAIQAVIERFGLSPSFFLFVGNMEPRKNLSGLLRAVRQLRQEGRDCRLAIAGPPGWRNRDISNQVARAESEGLVSRLGFVDDSDLAALYAASRALVMPSFHEGFGFPVIEAMSCGCPVIAARAGSLTEITGDAGILVDPHDVASIAAAMARIEDDEGLRADLVAKGRAHARQFRWSRCAQETITLYRDVLADLG